MPRPMYYPAAQEHSLLRPPFWRWERATDLLDNRRNWSRHRDDDWTHRAMAYLRAMQHLPEQQRAEKLAKIDPDVHVAHQLNAQGGPRHLEIQARLLAGQTVPEVAARVALPEPTVAAFEALFFHVRDRLGAADWITVHALGRGSGDPIAAIVLRSCAYYGGLVLLDAVLPYLTGLCDLFAGTPDLATTEGKIVQSLRLVLLAEALPRGAENLRALSRIHLLMLPQRKERPVQAPTAPLTTQSVISALEELTVPSPSLEQPNTMETTPKDSSRQTA